MTNDRNTDLGLLILRVSLGMVFLANGYVKIFVLLD